MIWNPRWWPEYVRYLLYEPVDYKKTPPTWEQVWCRVKGHPNGPIFYDLSGTEPNWKCSDCGEYLG